jgi:hypothetical protein
MRISRLALMAAAVLLTACGPQSQPPGQGQAAATAAPGDEEAALPADEAWVLPDQIHLASSAGGTDGPQVAGGTRVKILETAANATRVSSSDGAGWVPADALAAGMRRGVLTNDAGGLAEFTFVGYAPVEGDPDHVSVTAAPAEGGSARTATIEKTALSFHRDDISLAAAWREAQAEDDPAIRVDKLNKALVAFPSSRFASYVQETIESLGGTKEVAAEEFSQIATVDAAGTDVLSAPQGNVVGHLSGGEQVQTVERTKGTEDSRWYKLADPAGWVAGSSLKF